MNTTVNNPYIGPRTFSKEERHLFFGRDREARDLSALVLSENLVLFYAQSGAGKSSLINTSLIPELEQNLYEVFPVARVSGEAPVGFVPDNIYAYNLMRSLIRRDMDLKSLANLTLTEFLGKLNEDENGYFYDQSLKEPIRTSPEITPWRHALIVDQFEEVFNTNVEAWKKREDFFSQLAQAMQADAYLWVILIMREDYVAAMDPYAHLLPGGLRVRYYMQRLSRDAALKAVKSPVENLRPFATGVAENLINNLASIKVQKPGGEQGTEAGQYVEPVQLQVVCHNLWENLKAQGTQITEKDLLEVGDVSQSLERYYDQRVSQVASAKNIPERQIREWFERQLITSSGTRNMVLQDSRNESGLKDDVIQTLQGDLVRAEMRAGQLWYELSHDRLIEPVRKSNTVWFEKNLSIFQSQAELWNQQGRGEGLVLRGDELEKAEAEVKTMESNNMELTGNEQLFLDACHALKKREERDLRQRRTIFTALIVSIIFLIAAVIFGFRATEAQRQANEAYQQAVLAKQSAEIDKRKAEDASTAADLARQAANASAKEAKRQADIALAGNLAAQADSLKNNDHALALLLGVEAYTRDKNSLLARTTLFQLLQFSPYTRIYGFNGPVTSVAVSPNGELIAISSCKDDSKSQCKNGLIKLFDAKTNQLIGEIAKASGEYGIVYSMSFSPDGTLLAAGGCAPSDDNHKGCGDNKGQVTFWNVSNPSKAEFISDTLDSRFVVNHTALVKTIAFRPDGKILASGSYDKTIILWDVSDTNTPRPFGDPIRENSSFVNSLAFYPDAKVKAFVSAGDDRSILIFDYTDSKIPRLIQRVSKEQEHKAPVNSIAFSPNGKWFASASDDNTVVLWKWDTKSLTLQRTTTLKGHTGYVKSVAFSKDGTLLASASFDNKAILWEISADGLVEQSSLPLDVHSSAINALAFGSFNNAGKDLPYLLTGSSDHTAIKWDLATRRALSNSVETSTSSPNQTASSGNFKAMIDTTGNVTQIFLSNTQSPNIQGKQLKHIGQVNSVAFGTLPDNTLLLASASDDQTVVLWAVPDISKAEKFITLESFNIPVSNAYFKDGQHLITVDKNNRSVQWIIDPSEWMNQACAAIKNVELTQAQWDSFSQYLQGQLPMETCVTK